MDNGKPRHCSLKLIYVCIYVCMDMLLYSDGAKAFGLPIIVAGTP